MEETTRPGLEKASVGPLGPVLGETVGLGKLAKPVGRKPPSLPFLAALAEGKRDAKLSSFWTESFWNESLFPGL